MTSVTKVIAFSPKTMAWPIKQPFSAAEGQRQFRANRADEGMSNCGLPCGICGRSRLDEPTDSHDPGISAKYGREAAGVVVEFQCAGVGVAGNVWRFGGNGGIGDHVKRLALQPISQPTAECHSGKAAVTPSGPIRPRHGKRQFPATLRSKNTSPCPSAAIPPSRRPRARDTTQTEHRTRPLPVVFSAVPIRN